MMLPRCQTSTGPDLAAIADCHARAFPAALSTRLGRTFTEKMLEWYAGSPRGVLFHLTIEGEVAGYCGGIRTTTPDLPGAFTSISQHAFGSFVRAFLLRPWLLFHPEARPKWTGMARNVLIKAGRKPRPVPGALAVAGPFRPHWGLVVIGVDPRFRRRGGGAALLREFEDRAREEGVGEIRLSVRSDNVGAIEFYRNGGWSTAAASADSILMAKALSSAHHHDPQAKVQN